MRSTSPRAEAVAAEEGEVVEEAEVAPAAGVPVEPVAAAGAGVPGEPVVRAELAEQGQAAVRPEAAAQPGREVLGARPVGVPGPVRALQLATVVALGRRAVSVGQEVSGQVLQAPQAEVLVSGPEWLGMEEVPAVLGPRPLRAVQAIRAGAS